MNLLYTDIEDQLRASVGDLLTDRCAPAQVIARTETDKPYDLDLWRTLAADVGAAGLLVPEDRGGHGSTAREVAVVMEELGRHIAPVIITRLSVDNNRTTQLGAKSNRIIRGHIVLKVQQEGKEETAELVRAIRAVGAGQSLLDPAVTARVLDRLRRHKQLVADERLARLSPQEERILGLVAKGLTNGQIAGELGLAEKTVKNYVSSILSKLEVARRAEAAAYLARHTTPPGSN